jgi:hypothetical protein
MKMQALTGNSAPKTHFSQGEFELQDDHERK